ncbi:ABC transporter-related protein [Pyrolobus fumarii 1A]|uniref:ABC transporter-related protein n=1 Tax=Pyrolobus fumarii (strain DSM 11204 / 1A) TaxID=694429 RepID=G0EG47_PYRF1|nr:ABC transporter ATP-binding protein [Pyrolobus fumarii]AEM38295.1 ABC transporter-related protein [Pyrolobus fumarii 1A]
MTVVTRDIHAGYKGRPVLRGVSFAAEAGRLTVILGPNGAGKSTLLRVLAGLHRPDRGYAIIAGLRIPGASTREIARRVGYVPQMQQGRPLLTVIEYVAMSRVVARGSWRLRDDDLEEAYRALQLLGIEHLAGRVLSELSGGQRQLVSIAQALAKRPQVHLLDEPTSALDIRNQHMLLDLLREIARREKVTIVAVLHDITLAANYADDIIVMRDGTIVACGPPQEVLDEKLVSTVYGVNARIVELDGWRTVLVRAPGRSRLARGGSREQRQTSTV